MKRCPACNRFEPDDKLGFCRVDGTALISDSASLDDEKGTARFDSVPPSEIETSILHHKTGAAGSRTTGPTTVLPTAPTGTTGSLSKPKSRKNVIMIGLLHDRGDYC